MNKNLLVAGLVVAAVAVVALVYLFSGQPTVGPQAPPPQVSTPPASPTLSDQQAVVDIERLVDTALEETAADETPAEETDSSLTATDDATLNSLDQSFSEDNF
ncbi:MAG: hypothetical protein A2939_05285 [Parcubacteria group bacterium RIFCSPLOWO2_01_FULL_48_18]|nr:MAG: hypothetical protein A3J67_06685 [Parcubacteria group bacterium RIFCSPHIGHO2_02_FULL_48_10b]OHB22512.1 MAG: hypothetical protein A2939_05285 [Parcubacteria group bacterium RIFCSPLOWO2_01_FULL_48_18]